MSLLCYLQVSKDISSDLILLWCQPGFLWRLFVTCYSEIFSLGLLLLLNFLNFIGENFSFSVDKINFWLIIKGELPPDIAWPFAR